MCGIVGFYGNINEQYSLEALRKMMTRIEHRGPDESGVYISNEIAMGSVRLSILDLDSGTMPISTEDKRYWIVYNGEVYNFEELRDTLKELNHNFETECDTEVIVHLYQEYGCEFLNLLNGQFAISIWDKQKSELFLARDRVGIRPLFYTNQNGYFLFASEIKSFMEFPNLDLKISPESLSEYFTFWTAIPPNTIFEGIYEIPPGEYMLVNSKGKKLNKYWDLPLVQNENEKITDLEIALKEFKKIFEDSVKLRMRADVPVGAYLSGGLDSSITASFITSNSKRKLKTFSIAFNDKNYDESEYQKVAAEFFNTEHITLNCNSQDISMSFRDVIWHSEAPLLRTSPTPMMLLANNVKNNGIKVVMTGEGADELFGGYNIFKETKIRHFWAKDPNSKIRPLLLKKLYPYIPFIKNSGDNVLRMFFGYKLDQTESPIYSHLLRWNNTSRINNYLSDNFKHVVEKFNPVEKIEDELKEKLRHCDYLTKAQYIEMKYFMSGYLLSSQGDRMAMSNSIEGRYPFLDYRLIEFSMRLSSDLKLKGLNEKYILKEASKDIIPTSISNRSKQAYRAPTPNSFLSTESFDYFSELLSKKNINDYGIFNYDKVKILLDKLKRRGSEMDDMALIGIISVQILHELFVKKVGVKLEEEKLIKINKIIIE